MSNSKWCESKLIYTIMVDLMYNNDNFKIFHAIYEFTKFSYYYSSN